MEKRKGTVPGIILVDYFFPFPYSLTDQWELSSEKYSAFYKPIQEIIKFIDFLFTHLLTFFLYKNDRTWTFFLFLTDHLWETLRKN